MEEKLKMPGINPLNEMIQVVISSEVENWAGFLKQYSIIL